jgi:hypothetical protein
MSDLVDTYLPGGSSEGSCAMEIEILPETGDERAVFYELAGQFFRHFASRTRPSGFLSGVDAPVQRDRDPLRLWSGFRADLGVRVRDIIVAAESPDADRRDVADAVPVFIDYADAATRAAPTAYTRRAAQALRDKLEERGLGDLAPVRGSCCHWGYAEDMVSTVDGLVCQYCADEEYVTPVDADGLYHRDNLYYWESDEEYHTEHEPEPDDDDEYYDDGDDGDGDRLLGYSTNVMRHLLVDGSFDTSAHGDFHMGVELETMLTSGERDGKIRDVRAELGRDYLVAKQDGSLQSSGYPNAQGIEWVTRPTSLTTHVAKFGGWHKSSGDLVAWNAGCCGMHVHIDSRAFTATSLGKLLQFFNKEDNVDFIRAVAGRHPDRDRQADNYAGRDCRAQDTDTPLKALEGKNCNRYVMVNLTNLDGREAQRLRAPTTGGSSNTVEIRVYRASMRRERLLSQLEFTHALVMFCRESSYRRLSGADFKKWLAGNTHAYPNLAGFLDVRPNRHGVSRGVPPAVPLEVEVAIA